MKRFDPTEESNAWQLFVCLTSGADAAKEKHKKKVMEEPAMETEC